MQCKAAMLPKCLLHLKRQTSFFMPHWNWEIPAYSEFMITQMTDFTCLRSYDGRK